MWGVDMHGCCLKLKLYDSMTYVTLHQYMYVKTHIQICVCYFIYNLVTLLVY